MLGLIWAQARAGVIGRDNTIPWRVPEDTAHFVDVTTGHPVIMGRRTWDSLPPRFRPLADRRNIVVTRDRTWSAEGAEVVHSLDDALALAGDAETWVIGGGEIYAAALGRADRVVVTEIDLDVDGDAYAPSLGDAWTPESIGDWQTSRRDGTRFRFVNHVRR
ncbi:dihydrofolate reductase [Rhodococcus sp. NPDC003318]|uniref:dihydrofolate reductase n=1 Tax=Rhodococcus sp. NPDC003318 TaxID=3364503 RepID=UPI00368296FB